VLFLGRAEVIRLMLEFNGIEYKDKRYTKNEWIAVKRRGIKKVLNIGLIKVFSDNIFVFFKKIVGSFPFQQMPVLQLGRERIAQTHGLFYYFE
jgi:hypothetical protein